MNKKQKIQIRYTKWGTANNFGNYIEINKAFKKDKGLRDYIIKHELGHKKGFDLLHEFDIKPEIGKLFFFILKNPRMWIDFFPLQIKDKKIIYDANLFMLYMIILILLFAISKIL